MFWIGICFLLCTTIILIGQEIVDTPNALLGNNYKKTLCENYTNNEAPAKRIVILLVDGMRNSSASQHWISKIIDDKQYGRGEAIVAKPLTRAGLVAIFAGYYESVFSYMPLEICDTCVKEIKESLFNYVRKTYYFGPDIVKQYFLGSDLWSSFTHKSYINFEERYHAGDDETMVKIRERFEKPNRTLLNVTRLFYVHFTSVNIAGLINREESDNGKQQVLDEVADMIRETVEIILKHFTDNRTVFMILSDHGMTDWGTNADSSDDEVITPLIIWGNNNNLATGYLGKMKQVDICPLIASLLGIDVPLKSLGSFKQRYLNTTAYSLAHSAMCLAVQQAELCRNAWANIEQGIFVKHILGRTVTTCTYKMYVERLVQHMDKKNYSAVVETSAKLTTAAKACIRNIENFYKSCLLFALIMSYFAWIFGTVCMLSTEPEDKRFTTCASRIVKLLTCAGYVAMCAVCVVSIILEHLPLYFIPLVVTPLMAWMLTTLKIGEFITVLTQIKPLLITFYVVTLVAMVEFTYWAKYYPILFAFYLITYAAFQIITKRDLVPYHALIIYLITTVVLVITPCFAVIGLPRLPIVLNVSAGVSVILSWFFAYALGMKGKQCLLSLAVTAIICLSNWILDLNYLSSNIYLQSFSWAILALPIIVPVLSSTNLAERLFHVVISMGGPYLLLSTRYELFVFLSIALNLYAYVRIEITTNYYSFRNFARGINFYFYCILAIFASGNLPYLSSYDVLITKQFTSTPGDIQIALLTIYKLTAILTMITCFFYTLCIQNGGGGLRTILMVTTVTAAVASVRHSAGIIVSDNPVRKLPEFLLGNILYLLLLLPFSITPLFFISIKKLKK